MKRLIFALLIISFLVTVVSADTAIIYNITDGHGSLSNATTEDFSVTRASSTSAAGTGLMFVKLVDSTSASSTQISEMSRGAVIFDTSVLDDTASISAANLNVSVCNGGGPCTIAYTLGDVGIGVTKFTVDGSLSGDDFDNFQDTRYSSDKAISTITTGGSRPQWALNSAGMENISLTSQTGYMMRTAWDIDNSPPSLTDTTGKYVSWISQIIGPSVSSFLQVTYTLPPAAPVSDFSANVTTGAAPLSVGFTDLTSGTPTNWDWYWSNDETKDSDDQNPTTSFSAGVYNIRLYTSNAQGSDWENKTAYINSDGTIYSAFAVYGDGWISSNQSHTILMWNTSGAKGSWNASLNSSSCTDIDYVVVGGGGEGGYRLGGGGGGAGAFWEGTLSNLTGLQTVAVGAGGTGAAATGVSGASGGNSVFGSITANGGSGGASRAASGTSLALQGGSAGGGASPTSAGTGASNTTNQAGHGSNGGTGTYSTSTSYSGGGGGSAISVGTDAATTNAGDGGIAAYTNITGTAIVLAGGGGGGTYSTSAANRGQGGYNGSTVIGGLGGYRTNSATAPIASTGSGGGGGGSTGNPSGGSSGVIIIRYQTSPVSCGGGGVSAPVASFTLDRSVLRIPKTITATDTSTNTPTSWEWSWGDGTANSTTQNPTHTYTKRGKFAINMAAINAGGTGVATASTVRIVGYENP